MLLAKLPKLPRMSLSFRQPSPRHSTNITAQCRLGVCEGKECNGEGEERRSVRPSASVGEVGVGKAGMWQGAKREYGDMVKYTARKLGYSWARTSKRGG